MKAGILNKKTEVKRNIMNPLADVMTLIKKKIEEHYVHLHTLERHLSQYHYSRSMPYLFRARTKENY